MTPTRRDIQRDDRGREILCREVGWRVAYRHRPRTVLSRVLLMLMGYVSDERYSALHDVALEFVDDRGLSWEARSRATGAVDLDLPTGSYTVTLQGAGFGAKRSRVSVPVPRLVR